MSKISPTKEADEPDAETSVASKKVTESGVNSMRPSAVIFLTVTAVVVPVLVSLSLAFGIQFFGISVDFLRSNVANSIAAIIGEALYLTTLFLLLRGKNTGIDLKSLGWKMMPVLKTIWFVIVGTASYFLLSFTINLIVKVFMPGINADQDQNIGIQDLQGTFEFVIAYISLAIVPPVVEEILFRGFLFRGLRKTWSFLPSAVITSLLFGVVHGQINVGIDVFCLSLILCLVVEKTDSIVPAILIHAFKNNLAFILLFTNILPVLY